MGGMGLGQQLGQFRRRGLGLDFSALPALPSGRRSAVTNAANTAANILGVTAQSIVDALAVGRGIASLLPNDGCLLAASGGAVTVQGDPVGAVRTWTGVELATQANASLQPVSAASGLYADGAKMMSFGNLSAWTTGSAFVVSQLAGTTGAPTQGFWRIGANSSTADNDHVPYLLTTDTANTRKIFTSFGISSARRASTLQVADALKKSIFYFSQTGGNLIVVADNTTFINASGLTTGFSSNSAMFEAQTTSSRFLGTWSALSLNSTIYTTAQRDAVREFCKAYYGVTY